MSPIVVATVFGLVAVAELPDKTMIATLILGSRGRPVAVWIGASAAFTLHAVLAVAAGRALQLLPHDILESVVTALFLLGAAYLLLVPERRAEDQGEAEAARARSGAKVATTAFGVILVGEFGDLTQLLVLNLSAKYHQPFSVFLGAALALISVGAFAAFSGQALLRVLPVSVIRRIGGVVLLGFGAYSLYGLIK